MTNWNAMAGGEAEIGSGSAFPPEGVLVLPLCAQVERLAGGQRQRRAQRVPHSQTSQALPALGAHLHRHAERSALRRTTDVGGQERQNDTGDFTHFALFIFFTSISFRFNFCSVLN